MQQNKTPNNTTEPIPPINKPLCDITTCNDLQRLQSLLENDYSNAALLQNDFNHVLLYHNTSDDIKYIANTFGKCDTNKCDIINRYYNNQNQTTQNPMNGTDIIDKIHCHFVHTKSLSRSPSISHSTNIMSQINGDNPKDMFTAYSFGERYFYWNFFAHNNDINYLNHCNTYSDSYVHKKSSSLKDELLNNQSGETILRDHWKSIYSKAETLSKTHYCKQLIAKPDDWFTTKYGIDSGTQITISHLICIIIYCQSTAAAWNSQVELAFSSKDKHQISNFYHFNKYVIEAITLYSLNSVNKKAELYYVSHNMVFKSMIWNINTPLSATSSFSIAYNSISNDGLLSKMNTDYAKTFDCTWLSEFGSEHKHLVLTTCGRITLLNITNIANNKKHSNIVTAISVLESFINAFSAKAVYINKCIDSTVRLLIIKLIKHEIHRNDIHNKWKYKAYKCKEFDNYCSKLMHFNCQKTQIINIDYKSFNGNNYTFLKPYFVRHGYEMLDLQFLTALYPNIKVIAACNVPSSISNTKNLEYIYNEVTMLTPFPLIMLNMNKQPIAMHTITDYKQKFKNCNWCLFAFKYDTYKMPQIISKLFNKGEYFICFSHNIGVAAWKQTFSFIKYNNDDNNDNDANDDNDDNNDDDNDDDNDANDDNDDDKDDNKDDNKQCDDKYQTAKREANPLQIKFDISHIFCSTNVKQKLFKEFGITKQYSFIFEKYLQRTAAMQFHDKYLNDFTVNHNKKRFSIINFDFNLNNELYYGIIELQTGFFKKKEIKVWAFIALFNHHEIMQHYNIHIPTNDLPSSSRGSNIFVNGKNICNIIQKNRIKIIDNSKWHNVPILNKKRNKRRMVLKYSKEQFIINMKQVTSINIIPVVSFSHCIDYLWIVEIEKGAFIAIEINLEKNKEMIVSAIYLNWTEIYLKYKLAKPFGKCECLNGFKNNKMNHLMIGNPDDCENKIKGKLGRKYQNEIQQYKQQLLQRDKAIQQLLSQKQQENQEFQQQLSVKDQAINHLQEFNIALYNNLQRYETVLRSCGQVMNNAVNGNNQISTIQTTQLLPTIYPAPANQFVQYNIQYQQPSTQVHSFNNNQYVNSQLTWPD